MKKETIERIRQFSKDRDWDQFHSPANLAKSISIEANELLECFQWSDTEYDINRVKEELADVLVYCRNMLDKLNLDEDEIINAKMAQNEAKYPIAKSKGSNKKYTELEEQSIKSQPFIEQLQPFQKTTLLEFKKELFSKYDFFVVRENKDYYGFFDEEDIKSGIKEPWFYFAMENGKMIIVIKNDPSQKESIFADSFRYKQIEEMIKSLSKVIDDRKKKNEMEKVKIPLIVVSKMSVFDSLKNQCKHNCVEMDVKIPASTKKGNYECHPGPYRVLYCQKCKTYYISDEDLKTAKSISFPLIQYKPSEKEITGSGYGKRNSDLALESILKRSGYTVEAKAGLTDEQRIKILKTIIEFKLITKDRVIDYLKWFIRMNENSSSMETAVHKWKMDLKNIQ